ncbi:CoA transferase [Phenylobacterium sp.]|uniref:CaiB/BaiF CoA-transferase family protein n=1 Tax=Phenylobacterium sp. TaxID=1871053 RepID=UPI0025F1B1F3|nr:CoA transferase [Phenylobacterium sp.]
MDSLLAGLTVVEASRGVAVRYCGRLFAQLGATVVRAEGGDDQAIGYGGEAGEAYGRWLDQDKVATAAGPVDLVIAGQDASGVAVGEALAAGSPGAPALLALTWFHPDGPYGDWRGTDEVILALGGLAYAFGERAGPPILAQGHGPQVVAGIVGFNAAQAALLARPQARRIEVNVFEAFMCLTETGAVSALMEGGGSVRLGVNRFVPSYPCSSYRTADGWVGVTALIPAQWRGLCGMIGRPDLALERRFTTTLERLLLADEVDALVAPPFLERTTAEWVAIAGKARVPVTPMADLTELPDVPHWRDRGAFGPFDGSKAPAPTMPYRMTFTGPPAAAFAASGPAAPLSGLRVADFTMGWAGPLCTRTLADLGADVVKVESEAHPDWWRGWETDQSGDPPPRETKFNFIAMNRNKRGVYLDLSTPDGLARARTLVAGADVMVENFAAGVLEKLGLGPSERRALNPDLIAVSMPAFGNGGPLSGIRAYGSTVEQASGMPFANGHDDWPPCLQHVAFGDPIAGLYAAGAVLAAIRGRARKGGVEVDLAQVACLFQFAADALIAQQLHDGPLPRTGSARPRAAPVCVVAGAEPDSWLAVAVDGPEAWRGLCDVLEMEGWTESHALATPAGRNQSARILEAEIAAWSRRLDPGEAAARLQAAGVPAAPVQRVDALGYDPQLIAGGFWAEMDRRYVGRHLMPAAPFALDGARPALIRPSPTLGEHTAEVLAEL